MATLSRRLYDLVIDAQGLLKSLADPLRARASGRFRQKLRPVNRLRRASIPGLAVARGHAVERLRQLFAVALDFDLPKGLGDYGLSVDKLLGLPPKNPSCPVAAAAFTLGHQALARSLLSWPSAWGAWVDVKLPGATPSKRRGPNAWPRAATRQCCR